MQKKNKDCDKIICNDGARNSMPLLLEAVFHKCDKLYCF